MAPLQPIQKDASDKKVQSVLDLAKRICQHLNNREDIPQAVENELEYSINRLFPIGVGPAVQSRLSDLDSQGCELWNAATNTIREHDNGRQEQAGPSHKSRLVPLLRAFAFFLIDTTNRHSRKHFQSPDKRIRCFKTALKAGKCCLENSELDLALKVLERCSEYASATEKDSTVVRLAAADEETEKRSILEDLVAEFYLLRVMHAWKTDRLDLADHFFHKLSTPQLTATTRLWEKAANLFHEVGRSMLKRRLYEPSMKWSDRALKILDTADNAGHNIDAIELYLSTVSCTVECLLQRKDPNSLERAQSWVDHLHSMKGLGGRLAVQLMQLRVHLAHDPAPMAAMRDTILVMIRSTVFTDGTFKLIMKAIHKIRTTDAMLAYDALAELLDSRLLPDLTGQSSIEHHTRIRIEQVVVTLTFFATTDGARTKDDAVIGLQNVFDSVAKCSDNRFSSQATHAVQALMWKAASLDGVDHNIVENWCNLLGHRIFDSAGQINKDKIARKAILIAIEANNVQMARKAFFQMPVASQNENLTRYLAFKLAISSNDYRLAEESLEHIAKQAKDDQTFLYACVLVAQQSDMRAIAVAALQAIIDKEPAGAHFASLLRCTARLLVGELAAVEQKSEKKMEEVVRVFERAARSISIQKNTTAEQWRNEIQWWSKNAYNLSLEYCAEMKPEHLARLLRVCVAFIDAYSNTDKTLQEEGLKKRKASCHFLCATAYIVLGRTLGNGSEDSLQNYLHARQQIAAFQSVNKHMVGDTHPDLNSKAFELLKFDLECILHLQQWDQLDSAMEACLEYQSIDRWDSLADIVLIIRQQASIAEGRPTTLANTNKLLDKIINQTWQRDKNITKASRWLRLSFSMDLNNGNGDFALELSKQASNMAKRGYCKDEGAYPETELQWLASTAFNKAIDLLSAGMMDASTNWIQAALELARYSADNGALHANLTERKRQVMARLEQMKV